MTPSADFVEGANTTTGGRAIADRNWTECFAQLVGTVLSLWDAGLLDAAGQDGEVVPSFVNLSDASIKMVSPSIAASAFTLTVLRLSPSQLETRT